MSPRRLGAAAVVAAALAATALAGAVATGSVGLGHGRRPKGFTLRGHVGGLYPGAHRRLVVVVRNRGRRPLRIRSIVTRVRAARRGCSAKNLRVSRYRGLLLVRPGRSRRVALTIRMSRTSPTACQGAVFPLLFRGRGTR